MSLNTNVHKINIQSIITKYLNFDQEVLLLYCKSIWKDLAQRSDFPDKGINKITFVDYFPLPGILNDRVFSLFDKDKDGFLNKLEFVEGMVSIFSTTYDLLLEFVFKIYDFNNDGQISKEDIKSVMQYVNIKDINKENLQL